MKIELENGKYTYVFEESTGRQEVYRHGELWQDETGNGFLLAMAQRIESLEDELYMVEGFMESQGL
ncbi:hypothetical protein AXI76_gp179 [Pseudoalteromonas phage H101]|uniref:Uncharacterized protein n=1 Tax=Pseudoalteromonas phage H101 TaxID=1654919 RepID=A0A0H4J2B5_9CAUD|nr:hypothetical protein AXI76_gp179 [Pseudoalteromonas phage H101]AKO61080.1 hypothetical protein [Pseudoalteromonas phage H101]